MKQYPKIVDEGLLMQYEQMHTNPDLSDPTLSPQEQGLSKGIAAHYYDDGDYRLKRFDPNTFTADPEEWWDIDADQVLDAWVPEYLAMLTAMKLEPGEPAIVGAEVYWDRELIFRVVFDPYTPVPREESDWQRQERERGPLSDAEIEAAEMQRNG